MGKARVAVMVGSKGRGSNMTALVESCQAGQIPADIRVVISPVADSAAVESARSLGVTVEVCSPKSDSYASELFDTLRTHHIEWICLAGVMTKIPENVLHAFPDRILNIHPSLLPRFGGQGMYGAHVHRAVLAAGEQVSGCTVHIVVGDYDEGPILVQKRCPVLTDDTEQTLAARVLQLEHLAYPEALRLAIEQDAARG